MIRIAHKVPINYEPQPKFPLEFVIDRAGEGLPVLFGSQFRSSNFFQNHELKLLFSLLIRTIQWNNFVLSAQRAWKHSDQVGNQCNSGSRKRTWWDWDLVDLIIIFRLYLKTVVVRGEMYGGETTMGLYKKDSTWQLTRNYKLKIIRLIFQSVIEKVG